MVVPQCNRSVLFALLIALISSAICFAQTPVSPVESDASNASSPDLIIGPGDLIDVKVFGVPDLASTTRVSTGGEVTLPLLGNVHVSGLTVAQAQTLVQEKLVAGNFLRNPQVSIMIREFTNQGVSVLGEVQHPGFYPILHAHRLMDAISSAGGLTSRAGRAIIVTHRDGSAPTSVAMTFDATSLQKSNIDLQAGDIVNVGRAGIVYVTGDVTKPGGFVLDNTDSVSVLQALALAQGAKPTASLNKARIIRKTPSGPQEINVPLKEISSLRKPDVTMLPDDILFVPNSAGKSAGRKSIESITQIATGLLIYHPY